MRTKDEIKEWLAIREREALKDADTAEVTRWWLEHRQIASCTGGGRAFRRWLLWSRHSRPCVALGSRLRRQWPPRPMTSRKSNRLSP